MEQKLSRTITHITETSRVPSFSSYEERLHLYVHEIFSDISGAARIDMPGNNLVYRIPGKINKTIALTAHLDKINHYGEDYPNRLPVEVTPKYVEGAMDNSMGIGVLLTLAELTEHNLFPDLLFFFSEMEESKGLKEHPERLKNNGKGYESGMGAKRIARKCIELNKIPDEVITVDTTPLFNGKPGLALYSRHWELNKLDASPELIEQTKQLERDLLAINDSIKIDNNTNDYLHYGFVFNESGSHIIPSVALEPSIYPYHQLGEKVFINDITDILEVLTTYLNSKTS